MKKSEAKKKRFARKVFAGKTQTKAAVEVGYSPATAGHQVGRLMQDPVVQAELAALDKADQGTAIRTRNKIVRRLMEDFDANVADFIRVSGQTVALDLEKARKRGLVRLLPKLRVKSSEDGQSFEIQLPDRLGIVDRVARILGWYAPERREHSGKVEVAGMLPREEAIKLIAEEIEFLQEAEHGKVHGAQGRRKDVCDFPSTRGNAQGSDAGARHSVTRNANRDDGRRHTGAPQGGGSRNAPAAGGG